MTSNEIIQVLKSHRNISTVTLQKATDCRDFWEQYTASVFYSLPSTTEGIGRDYEIQATLNDFASVDTLELVNKKGRLLKRFANYWKSEHGFKLPDSFLGMLGDKLQQHLNSIASMFYYDFTDVIDWNDGQFGKGDSCWWGCYKESQDVYTENGGWGIRFYDSMDDENGIGRTWIIPHNGMLLGFNSYGVSRPQTSKVIKAIFAEHGIKLHYKQCSIENSQDSEIPYINGDSGFVLYPDTMDGDDVPTFYDLDMETNNNKTRCEYCNCILDEYDYTSVGDYQYCESCTNKLFSFCDRCEEYCNQSDVHHIKHSCYSYLCEYCIEHEELKECYECNEYVSEYITDSDDNNFCEHCAEHHLTQCESCQEYTYGDGAAHECPNSLDTSGLIESNESEFHAKLSLNGRIIGEYHTTTVYRLSECLGLALYNPHRINSEFDNGWNISHDTSGLAIKSGIPTFRQAKELLIALYPMADWNVEARTLSDNRELMNQVSSTIKTILGA